MISTEHLCDVLCQLPWQQASGPLCDVTNTAGYGNGLALHDNMKMYFCDSSQQIIESLATEMACHSVRCFIIHNRIAENWTCESGLSFQTRWRGEARMGGHLQEFQMRGSTSVCLSESMFTSSFVETS